MSVSKISCESDPVCVFRRAAGGGRGPLPDRSGGGSGRGQRVCRGQQRGPVPAAGGESAEVLCRPDPVEPQCVILLCSSCSVHWLHHHPGPGPAVRLSGSDDKQTQGLDFTDLYKQTS